jgi:hypothetical protein
MAKINKMRLIVKRRKNDISVRVSSPGTGFLSFRIYPNIVKIRTVIATAKLKMIEEALSILVDL